ncbi:hypothetical protein CLOM_g10977 [Closterium sp. NIES-68]|nr:hypothetical protein CLOM_g10977 [Closterium sp. NIES-68]GJP86017.1 hypothetical protein CLOP_g16087 [Closterium sp. NIES-67]
MPPPRARADATPLPSSPPAPSAPPAASASSAPSSPFEAMPPPPARPKGKVKAEAGRAEGETPVLRSGEGESGEGDTRKVVRSRGATEGENPRGSAAEGESTGGSGGNSHEIRGEPTEGGKPGRETEGADPHLAKRLEAKSSADKSLEPADKEIGIATPNITAAREGEGGDEKAGKESKGAANSGDSGGGAANGGGNVAGDSSGGDDRGGGSKGSSAGRGSSGGSSSGSSGRAPYSIPDWAAVPKVPFRVEVVKEGAVAEEMDVSAKSAYMFGRIDCCDFMLQHPSISRYHAVIQYGEDSAAFVMDLNSTHKTFVNKQEVKPGTYVPLRVGDVIKFGLSSRLYLFQGPPDLMPEEGPSRAERRAQRQLAAERRQVAAREAAEREQRRAVAAGRGEGEEEGGVSWGMREDAEAEVEEEDEEEVTWQTHKGELTDNQRKLKEKIMKRLEKVQHMQREMDVIEAKEVGQGGLTAGQQTQIARNKTRIQQLMEEVESMEETLNESIQESVGAKKGGRKGRAGRQEDEEDEGDDSDDEFFDRVQSNRHRRQARIALAGVKSAGEGAAGAVAGAKGGAAVVTAADLLEQRHVLQERLREVEEGLEEERRKEGEGRGEGEGKGGGEGEGDGVALDPLDAFMSAVNTKIEKDKTGTLTREAARLSGELARVAALLQLADPSGEAEAKWTPPSDKGKGGGRKKQKAATTLPAAPTAAPIAVPGAADKDSAGKGEGSKVKGGVPDAEVGEGESKAGLRDSEGETRGTEGSAAAARGSTAEGAGTAAAGIEGRGRLKGGVTAEGGGGGNAEGEGREGIQEARVGSVESTGGEEVGGAWRQDTAGESVGGGKRRGGGDTGSAQGRSKTDAADGGKGNGTGGNSGGGGDGDGDGSGGGGGGSNVAAGSGSGGGEVKRRRVLGPARPKFLEEAAAEMEQGTEAWMPPQGQSGDGRTLLNKKLGY